LPGRGLTSVSDSHGHDLEQLAVYLASRLRRTIVTRLGFCYA